MWNDDWTAALDAQGRHVIRARAAQAGVDLVLDEGKPPAINGIDGISQKGAQAGNASHYYSLTRMPTRGAIVVDGERFEVAGESWMDHEFGTSFLEPEQQGWDWLSIQLARWPRADALSAAPRRRLARSAIERHAGRLVTGRTAHLAAADFTLAAAGRTFRAPSGATYPIRWTVSIPGRAARRSTCRRRWRIRSSRREARGVPYWEGLIDVAGTSRGAAVAGRGYLEMTGYKGSLGRVMTPRS